MATKSKPARNVVKRMKTVCCICSKPFSEHGKRDCWCLWKWLFFGFVAVDVLVFLAVLAVLLFCD